MPFYIWFISLSIVSLKFIHVAACQNFLPFEDWVIFHLWIYHFNLSIYLFCLFLGFFFGCILQHVESSLTREVHGSAESLSWKCSLDFWTTQEVLCSSIDGDLGYSFFLLLWVMFPWTLMLMNKDLFKFLLLFLLGIYPEVFHGDYTILYSH